jgi:predicted RNA-binding protein with PIN domain
MLVIDAANVIGSQPTGWWQDRAGAARSFVERIRNSARQGRLPLPAVVVLEGAARAAVAEADVDGVRVVHASHSGDDAVVAETRAASNGVIVVTADRALRERVRKLGAERVGPRWLTDRLQPDQE